MWPSQETLKRLMNLTSKILMTLTSVLTVDDNNDS